MGSCLTDTNDTNNKATKTKENATLINKNDAKNLLIEGMKQYATKWEKDYNIFQKMGGEGEVDLIQATIKCDNISSNIKHYIESFWNKCVLTGYYHAVLQQLETFEYDDKYECDYDDKVYRVWNEKFGPQKRYINRKQTISYQVLLDSYNEPVVDYVQTIKMISNLLTGNMRDEMNEEKNVLLLNGFLREFNLPNEIHEICDKYHDKISMVNGLRFEWGDDEKKASDEIHKLLMKVIECNNNNNICWKCVLIKGKIDFICYGYDEGWYLWWFINNENKTNDQSDCIVIKFRYASYKTMT